MGATSDMAEETSNLWIPAGIFRMAMTTLCLGLWFADLNQIQLDSHSEVIDLAAFLPRFMLIMILPAVYTFSAAFVALCLFTEIVVLRLYKRKYVSFELLLIFLWFLLAYLHVAPRVDILHSGFSSEDLYILQLACTTATLAGCLLCSAISAFSSEQKKFSTSLKSSSSNVSTSNDAHSKPFVPSPPSSVSIIRGIHQNRTQPGSIRKRRYRRDGGSPNQVGKWLKSLNCTSDRLSIVPSDAGSIFNCGSSITGYIGQRDDTELASVCSWAPTLKPASSIVSDDDTTSVFSGMTLRNCASTVFYPASSIMEEKYEEIGENGKETRWRMVVAIVLLLSVSINAILLGYLIMTPK